jgi:hypothetical protein
MFRKTSPLHNLSLSLSHYTGGWPGPRHSEHEDKEKNTNVCTLQSSGSESMKLWTTHNNFHCSTATKWQAVDQFNWYRHPCYYCVSVSHLNIRTNLKMHLKHTKLQHFNLSLNIIFNPGQLPTRRTVYVQSKTTNTSKCSEILEHFVLLKRILMEGEY